MEAAQHSRPERLVPADRGSASFWEAAEEKLFFICGAVVLAALGSPLKGKAPDPAPRLTALLRRLFCSTNFRCGFRQTVLFPRLIDSQ